MAKRTVLFVAALTLVLSACGKSGKEVQPAVTYTTVGVSKAPSDLYSCTKGNTECETLGVRFKAPLTLSEVEQRADTFHANVIALWRENAICVADVQRFSPGSDSSQKHSQFAYWHADVLVDRANKSNGPPITDGGYTFSYRRVLVDEWNAANQPGVKFFGAVFFLPVTQDPSWPDIEAAAPISSSLAAAQKGVIASDLSQNIYLQEHEKAMAPLFKVDESKC